MKVNPFTMRQIALDADESDEDVCRYEFHDRGRLILDTVHGMICIDIRGDDVNAYFIDQAGVRL